MPTTYYRAPNGSRPAPCIDSPGGRLHIQPKEQKMVRYQDLGLSNTREMFKKAMAGGYAIPAYNFNNLEQLQAIIQGCIQSRSPVILQISKGARQYANQTLLRYMAEGAMKVVKESGVPIPVA